MQNSGSIACRLSGEGAHGGDSKPQNLYRAVPRHHNLRRFKAVMHEVLGMSMIEALAGLSGDVLQVPNGKSFFSSQHGGDAVALHVLKRGAENAAHFFGSVEHGNIVTVENLAGRCFFEKVLHQNRRLLAQRFQFDGLERHRLSALRIGGLVDGNYVRVRDFAKYFEAPDFVRHYLRSLMKTNRDFPSVGKTSGMSLGGSDVIRIVREHGESGVTKVLVNSIARRAQETLVP